VHLISVSELCSVHVNLELGTWNQRLRTEEHVHMYSSSYELVAWNLELGINDFVQTRSATLKMYEVRFQVSEVDLSYKFGHAGA
jgi:hypothetical protein